MPNSSPKPLNTIDIIGSVYSELTNLPEQELVTRCRENDPQAWNEFCRRYVRLLYATISNTLVRYGYARSQHTVDEEIIVTIYDELIIKFITKDILRQCVNVAGIIPWLRTVATNQTLDWLASNNNPTHVTEIILTTSLHSPTGNEESQTIEDSLSDETDEISLDLLFPYECDLDHPESIDSVYLRERLFLEHLLVKLDALKSRKLRDYWIMRLWIMIQLPLDSDEIEELSIFSPLERETLLATLQNMSDIGDRKTQQKDEILGRSIMGWYKIRRLEARYRQLDNPSSQQAIDLIEEIATLEKTRSRNLIEGKKIPLPSRAAIAAIVGISVDQKSYVSTLIQRIRKELF